MKIFLTILLLLVSFQFCYADPLNPEDEIDPNKEYTVEEVFGFKKEENLTNAEKLFQNQQQRQLQTQRVGPAKRFGGIIKGVAEGGMIYLMNGGSFGW